MTPPNFTPTKYLYGKEIGEFPDASAHFQAKIEAAKGLLDELMAVELDKRDEERIRKVSNAIFFNKLLLDGEI